MKEIIKKENKTPAVYLDEKTSTIFISGVIAPENPEHFFNKLNEEFINISKNYNHLKLDLKLDYFNTGSSRYLFLFLNNLNNKNNIEFIWRYEKGDEDIFESGKELESLCNIEFKFIEEEE